MPREPNLSGVVPTIEDLIAAITYVIQVTTSAEYWTSTSIIGENPSTRPTELRRFCHARTVVIGGPPTVNPLITMRT
jgi:hypothetical protein